MEVGEGIQEKEVRKNASTKNLGLCYRVEGGIYTKKGKGILTVQGEKRGGASICRRLTKERIYPPFQVTPNVTSTLHSKEGWYMENGAGLSTHKLVNDKEWVSLTSHCRHTGWGRKEKGVYKAGPEMGDTIMSGSKREMSGRQHLQHILELMNPWSCTSG